MQRIATCIHPTLAGLYFSMHVAVQSDHSDHVLIAHVRLLRMPCHNPHFPRLAFSINPHQAP
jgi:hypothetical protein